MTARCKECAHFRSLATPGRIRLYEKRIELSRKEMLEYKRYLDERNNAPWWKAIFRPPFDFVLPPYPFLERDPRAYGFCHLDPKAVEVGIGHYCSHFHPTQPTEHKEN